MVIPNHVNEGSHSTETKPSNQEPFERSIWIEDWGDSHERLTNEAHRHRLRRGAERSRGSKKLRESERQCRRGPSAAEGWARNHDGTHPSAGSERVQMNLRDAIGVRAGIHAADPKRNTVKADCAKTGASEGTDEGEIRMPREVDGTETMMAGERWKVERAQACHSRKAGFAEPEATFPKSRNRPEPKPSDG